MNKILWIDDGFCDPGSPESEILSYIQKEIPNAEIITVETFDEFIERLDFKIDLAILDIEGYGSRDNIDRKTAGFYAIGEHIQKYDIPVIVFSGHLKDSTHIDFVTAKKWTPIDKFGDYYPVLLKKINEYLQKSPFYKYEFMKSIFDNDEDVTLKDNIINIIESYKSHDYNSIFINTFRQCIELIFKDKTLLKIITTGLIKFKININNVNNILLGLYTRFSDLQSVIPTEIRLAIIYCWGESNIYSHAINREQIQETSEFSAIKSELSHPKQTTERRLKMAYHSFFIIMQWYDWFKRKHIEKDYE